MPRRAFVVPLALFVLALGGAGCSQCGKTGARASTGVVELGVGSGQACVRMIDKSVWCWGSNALGSVGVRAKSPTHQFHETPVRVANVSADRLLVVSIQTCFEPAGQGGTLSCWGGGLDNVDAHPRLVERLPKGRLFSSEGAACVLGDDGVATCFGENESGRITPNDKGAVRATFGKKIGPTPLAIGAPVTSLAIGGRHGCALLRDKKVTCWGLNNFGQLGVERYPVQERAEPTVVSDLDDVEEIASGYFHSCARKSNGTVWCWGRGDHGELGIGTTLKGDGDGRHMPTPTQVPGLDGVAHIYASSNETCAVTKKGALWCWGHNDKGQIGDGTSEDRFEPVRVEGMSDVTQVSIGFAMVCAMNESGEVFCWGDNRDGALGNGGVEAAPRPTKVKLPVIRGGTASASAEAVPPPVAKAPRGTPTAYESLACGFVVTVPAKRTTAPREDLVVEGMQFEPFDDASVSAHCTLREKQHDKDADAMAKRFAEEDDGGAMPKPIRRKIGDADCLDLAYPTSRSLLCFGATHFVSISARSKDTKLVSSIIDSVAFFDPKAALPQSPPLVPDADASMLLVPAGPFAMGCANQSLHDKTVGALGCTEDAQPLHRVKLSAFAIDRRLVTVGDFGACVSAQKCTAPSYERFEQPKADDAVRKVSWEQARSYCVWKGKALPTEAQWERAAPSTDLVLDKKEWVFDGFARSFYLESPVDDPTGPKDAHPIHRALRGALFGNGPRSDSVTHRQGKEPSLSDREVGFRCAAKR